MSNASASSKLDKTVVKRSNPRSVASNNRHSNASNTSHTSSKKPELDGQVTASATPGLLTLSKPLHNDTSTEQSDSDAASSQRKPRKATSRKKDRKVLVEAPHSDGQDEEAILIAHAHGSRKDAHLEASSDLQPSSAELLSKSAPLPSTARSSRRPPAAQEEWEMPGHAGTQSSLNWQQQLMASSKPQTNKAATSGAATGKKSRKGRPAGEQTGTSLAAMDRDTLTWQQALFNEASTAKRGPQFDRFADSRDAETFGDDGSAVLSRSLNDKARDSGKASKASKAKSDAMGDLSLDDIFAGSKGSQGARASSSPALARGLSTPSKKGAQKGAASSPAAKHHLSAPKGVAIASGAAQSTAAAAGAYAGPDFHNSPSAASLPAPKFGSRGVKAASVALKRQGSTSSGSSRGSEAGDNSMEVATARATRGTTAPPAPMSSATANTSASEPAAAPSTAPPNKAATIENLLARLMGGTSL